MKHGRKRALVKNSAAMGLCALVLSMGRCAHYDMTHHVGTERDPFVTTPILYLIVAAIVCGILWAFYWSEEWEARAKGAITDDDDYKHMEAQNLLPSPKTVDIKPDGYDG